MRILPLPEDRTFANVVRLSAIARAALLKPRSPFTEEELKIAAAAVAIKVTRSEAKQ